VYGSYAPTSANPFIDDNQLKDIWQKPNRYYIFARNTQIDELASVVGKDRLIIVSASGGKVLLTNQPLVSQGNY
jgi:hypothetical protein